MIYYTVPTPKRYHQPTFHELLFVDDDQIKTELMTDDSSTTTRKYENIPDKVAGKIDRYKFLNDLTFFNKSTERLRNTERRKLYNSFKIPKKSGGLRPIDQPLPELEHAQRDLLRILTEFATATHHTSAFAYVPGRCTINCIEKHQYNKSKWFLKLDMKSFFPNTSIDFVMKQLEMIFPFSEILAWDEGKAEMRKALELGFLDGGLPQGSSLSPFITNIMMIPIDYELNKMFNQYNKQHFVYTRYADDILISSVYDFNYKDIINSVNKVLKDFDTPFYLNDEKTRYGSSAGSNWNLGVMLNKDNQITIGHKQKKRFKAMISNYSMDKKHDIEWELGDLRTLLGYINYYRMVEKECINEILMRYSCKYNMHIEQCIRKDIKRLSNI